MILLVDIRVFLFLTIMDPLRAKQMVSPCHHNMYVLVLQLVVEFFLIAAKLTMQHSSFENTATNYCLFYNWQWVQLLLHLNRCGMDFMFVSWLVSVKLWWMLLVGWICCPNHGGHLAIRWEIIRLGHFHQKWWLPYFLLFSDFSLLCTFISSAVASLPKKEFSSSL